MRLHPRFGRAVAAAALVGAAAAGFSGCATSLGAQGGVLRARDTVAPALVHIRPVKEVYTRGKREEVLVIGSGFIISPDGYVVTNEHVAGESKYVRCVLSNKDEVQAEVVGTDAYTDIAVLKLNVPQSLPHVRWADGERLLQGQTVLALGSPHGLARSVSLGIISVTDRYLGGEGTMASPYNNWIQTDAAINPGNSGGPLVNLKGEVVGVNARVLSGAENVGFAIPANIAREVVEEIIEKGRVQRSDLGFVLQEMLARTEDPNQRGVVIADVDPLSPSFAAGVRPGDILLSVNGHATDARFEEDLPLVRKRIADLPVGEAANLVLLRNEETLYVPAPTEELSALKGMELEFAEWGFTARDLTPEIVRSAQLPARNGVLVSGVQVGGVASEAGLGRGDIVLTVDGELVQNLAEFQRIHRERVESQQELVLLMVKRGALTRFVLVKQRAIPLPGAVGGRPLMIDAAPETPEDEELEDE
jgi:serine protease Do